MVSRKDFNKACNYSRTISTLSHRLLNEDTLENDSYDDSFNSESDRSRSTSSRNRTASPDKANRSRESDLNRMDRSRSKTRSIEQYSDFSFDPPSPPLVRLTHVKKNDDLEKRFKMLKHEPRDDVRHSRLEKDFRSESSRSDKGKKKPYMDEIEEETVSRRTNSNENVYDRKIEHGLPRYDLKLELDEGVERDKLKLSRKKWADSKQTFFSDKSPKHFYAEHDFDKENLRNDRFIRKNWEIPEKSRYNSGNENFRIKDPIDIKKKNYAYNIDF